MFSYFKKKEKVELSSENFMHANPQDFGWDLVGENDVNTTTIGSGEVSIGFINGEKSGFAKPFSIENLTEVDNSYETKISMIKSHLYEKGNISSLEAINLYNATRLSDIIFKLKKTGLDISTTPETYGRSRFVRYHLNKAI